MWYQNKLSKEGLRFLESLKSVITPLLDTPQHRHFTDHKVSHSEKIIDIIGMILDGYGEKINEDELFVLLAVAYMHDIGMQIKKSDLLKYPELNELLSKSNLTMDDLESETNLLNFIREWHHIFTYYFITALYRKELGLEDCRYTEEIALVAQGHRQVDLFSELYQRGAIRIDFLSALVKIG